MEKHGLTSRVVALLTDTPYVMKALWDKVQAKYPKISGMACWAHVLQLFLTAEYQKFMRW